MPPPRTRRPPTAILNLPVAAGDCDPTLRLPDILLQLVFRHLDAREMHLSVVRVCRRWTMLAASASVTEVFSADIERGKFAMLRIPNDRVYDVQWNQWPNAGMPEPRCSSCTATTPWRGMLPKIPTLLAWAARSARTGTNSGTNSAST